MSGRVVSVVPYDPAWPQRFAEERVRLRSALAETAVAIFHIGSTAVPGLAAKPIIDILVAASSLQAIETRHIALAAMGYVSKGENGIVGRRYFQKGGAERSHHLHIYQHDNPHLVRHLAFRDYLRAHPAVSAAYAALKRDLAGRHQRDSAAYQDGKADFLQSQQDVALAWYAVTDPSLVVTQASEI